MHVYLYILHFQSEFSPKLSSSFGTNPNSACELPNPTYNSRSLCWH